MVQWEFYIGTCLYVVYTPNSTELDQDRGPAWELAKAKVASFLNIVSFDLFYLFNGSLYVRCMLWLRVLLETWKVSDNVETIVLRKNQLLISGYKIIVCDDELEWVGRWLLWWIKWHLHHVKFETGMSDRSLCLKTTPICQNFQLRNKERKFGTSLFCEQFMYVRNAAINFTQGMQLFFALILNRLE